MLKVGAKRRRTKGEIKQEKLEEKIKNDSIVAKMLQFDQMQAQMDSMQQQVQENEQAKNVLNNLIAQGELYQDASSGDVIVADDPPSKKRPGRPRKD